MPRKAIDNVKQMDDEVIKCFIHPVKGTEETTQAERAEVARQWCAGDYSHHIGIAEKHELLPIALLIAALVDMDHPLLSSGRGVAYNSLQCSIIITNVMYHGETVAQPMATHSFHSRPVERIEK